MKRHKVAYYASKKWITAQQYVPWSEKINVHFSEFSWHNLISVTKIVVSENSVATNDLAQQS